MNDPLQKLLTSENKSHSTGKHEWIFGAPIRWDAVGASHWNEGPCPRCGYPTSNYGGGWACHNDMCHHSIGHIVCNNGPAPQWWNTRINVYLDGNAWCVTMDDFINLQESPAGFGDTPDEAVKQLLKELETPTP